MALGIGQGNWSFSSPDFPNGANDYAATAGAPETNPYVVGPAINGFADTTGGGGNGAVHVNTGANPGANPAGTAAHWSNVFNLKGPVFWLLLFTILYLGLISLRVGARIGVGR